MRVLVLLLLLAPLATAQGHEHNASGIAIVSDLSPDHVAHVGTPAHFALIAFGDDRVPDFHQDLPVRVLLDGQLLWETTTITGHDYDGVSTFAVTFPAPGPFRVEALEGGEVAAHYNGTAVQAEPLPDVALNLVPGTNANGGQSFSYNITSAGQRLHHVDAWLELWWEGQLVFRTHTHTHEEDQSLWVRYPSPGEYTVRLVGYQAYPTERGAAFTPVVHEQSLAVTTPTPSLIAPATPDAALVPTAANAVVHGSGGALYELVGTYDPFTRVGPGTLQTLSALVIDPETGVTVQHVDFEARLVGPRGEVFRSDTLHEYDGIYELATRQHDVGLYVLEVTATRGDWSADVEIPYLVVPPVQPTIAGPQRVSLDASPAPAGQAMDVSLSIRDLADRPFAHGEVHAQVLDTRGVPLVQAKLHTHGGGDYPFRIALPAAGEHDLLLSPFPLSPEPATAYDLSAARVLVAEEGAGFVWAADGPKAVEDAQAPGLPVALVLVVAAFLARRR